MKDQVTLFLCGDVMTGRGIDQILPHPGDSRLHEPCMESSLEYVKLAERASDPINRPVDFSYIWGDALEVFQNEQPQAKVINLETTITPSDTHWRSKDVHYKMSPENIGCLIAAGIDCCVLANNHMLDWGVAGLLDTLVALDEAGIKHVGAGRSLYEAQQPAILPTGGDGSLIVFSLGSTSSGIPIEWSAKENRPGLSVIESRSDDAICSIARKITEVKKEGDVVVISIHWGGNWGYKIPYSQKKLAHRFIDEIGVDIVHGHSSHHVKAIEVYKERLILYGCGDFLNDYEGISGYENFRGDLALMYFADLNPATGKLLALRMIPTQVRRFRVNRASEADTQWLEALLNREGKRFGTAVQRSAENFMTLDWS
jgi:poly-gamma-glutamate capsule biosynthesis protein CapA/YwtB (metallophosphatase superfamily)